MNRYIKNTLTIICFLIVLSCSKSIDQSMVIGRYTAVYKNKNINETLEIVSDGTYSHTFQNEKSEKINNVSHWQFKIDQGEARIIFYDYIPGLRLLENHYREKRTLDTLILCSFFTNKIKIPILLEGDYYFVKQAN